MIDSNLYQLRIGNLLFDDKGDVINIGHIQNNFYGVFINGRSPWFFNPIPLTEEWLKSLGLKRIGCANLTSYRYQEFDLSFSFGNYGVSSIEKNPSVSISGQTYYLNRENAMFVHQLQNLYFVLNGVDLPFIESL